jgi:hypothetical protein
MSEDKSRLQTLRDELFEAQSQKTPYQINLEDFKLLAEKRGNLNWIQNDFASMSDFNLNGKLFDHAQLYNTHFTNGSMRNSRFTNANMHSGTYINVDFFDAGFYKADLEGVEFINCNLAYCRFAQADLTRVRGLRTITSVGDYGRLIYAYVYNGEIRIQAGCRNGTVAEIKAAVADKYEYDKDGLQDYNDAIWLLERWGKREIKRLKAAAKSK